MHLGKKLFKMLLDKQEVLQGQMVMPAELEKLQSYIMGDKYKTEKLYTLALDVMHRKVAGDIVECGVCNGGSAATISLGFRLDKRRVWLYDSFEGMPATKEIDGAEAAKFIGACVGNEENVRHAMRIAGYDSEDYVIRKGWFENTFKMLLPGKIAFLHIDADWYDSVILSLDTFYDRVEDGGVIVLDDFGHWEGCRESYYDFIQKKNIKPLLERFGRTIAFWIKGKTHNRDFVGNVDIQ